MYVNFTSLLTRVADPGGFYPDPDNPIYEKKPDPTFKKIGPNPNSPLLISFDMKVHIIYFFDTVLSLCCLNSFFTH